jgi:hypothetical protein
LAALAAGAAATDLSVVEVDETEEFAICTSASSRLGSDEIGGLEL